MFPLIILHGVLFFVVFWAPTGQLEAPFDTFTTWGLEEINLRNRRRRRRRHRYLPTPTEFFFLINFFYIFMFFLSASAVLLLSVYIIKKSFEKANEWALPQPSIMNITKVIYKISLCWWWDDDVEKSNHSSDRLLKDTLYRRRLIVLAANGSCGYWFSG